jgi:2-polyprenyl-3-methyl-5-hydroxy-6-metoxy-1,4-benzoquinol methylase
MDKLNYFSGVRPEVADFLPDTRPQRILEIGCGLGNFRKNINYSCEYWGVEPCLDAANVAKINLDKVLIGRFSDVVNKLPDNFFDCIICADVIEHMDDHDWFLDQIKMKLKSNGSLIGSIPNIRYIGNLYNLIYKKDWLYVDAGILDRTHLRFFTEKSLKTTLVGHGYKIEKLHGINGVVIKMSSLKYFLQSLGANLISFFIGRDTRFVQFGFRVTII